MRQPLQILLVLLALTLAVFALWPGVDLAVARFFYEPYGFIGRSAVARAWRDVYRLLPVVVLAGYAIAYLSAKAGRPLPFKPDGRQVLFLAASIAIGSGLIVNVGMKDHLHRPRPVQTRDFGGDTEFRPWYRFDGGCQKNCGFPSGEASSGFWMVAPALLVPTPWRGEAVVAAVGFGAGASLLRMAFGGHYLSDVLVGGLISLIVIFVVRRFVWPNGPP